MPALDVETLVREMMQAAAAVLKKKQWRDAGAYAEAEFRKLAQTATMIASLRARRRITRRQAELLLEMQHNAMRSVLLTVEGIGILAAEAAINAALGAARDTINRVIGWRIL
jgi:hypothetical protein